VPTLESEHRVYTEALVRQSTPFRGYTAKVCLVLARGIFSEDAVLLLHHAVTFHCSRLFPRRFRLATEAHCVQNRDHGMFAAAEPAVDLVRELGVEGRSEDVAYNMPTTSDCFRR